MEQVCADAGLPLLRRRAGRAYAAADLTTQIRRAVEGLDQDSAYRRAAEANAESAKRASG